MQIEIRELELRYAGLRIVDPRRQARLESSLAREGQQSAVLVVKAEDGALVLVDGYRRVAALQSLSRDVVEVALLPLEEAAALVEVWRLETARRRTALEDAWLLAELLERHGRSPVQELGVAPAIAGAGPARVGAAGCARRHGATAGGDEVPGAVGPGQRRALRAAGGGPGARAGVGETARSPVRDLAGRR
jgi:hypothetical protein